MYDGPVLDEYLRLPLSVCAKQGRVILKGQGEGYSWVFQNKQRYCTPIDIQIDRFLGFLSSKNP